MSTQVRDEVQKLVQELLDLAIPDAEKHGKGNSAAGTRLRKTLMNVANRCKELRVQVQQEKKNIQEEKKNG